jgi:long-chain acyl-CoA synthetase
VQGYGMTENCAQTTLGMYGDNRPGHVGPPIRLAEVKLVDVPEMNFSVAVNNSGEVLTRGPSVFAGYHKDAKETAEVIEPNGWMHTGDIGRWNADGTLSIIDRKKNIFKLSQGEYVWPPIQTNPDGTQPPTSSTPRDPILLRYVAAEKIEMVISKSKYVSQPWIYGNSFFPMLVAVVVPDLVELRAAAVEGGWDWTSAEDLMAKPEAAAFLLKAMVAEGKAGGLKPFELPVKCVLEGKINTLLQGFSIENDCLTPTFKLKRPQLLKRYQQQIDGMYAQLGHQPGPTGGERASALPRISVGGQGDGKCTPQQQNTARSFFSLSTNRTPRFGGKEDVWAV